MTTKIDPRKVHHVPHGTPEFVGDSMRAIRMAQLLGEPWIDINWLKDVRGNKVATHYRKPLRHGFHDPKDLIKSGTDISDLHPHQWTRLRAIHNGHRYRMTQAQELIPFCEARGRKMEFEPKTRMTVDDFEEINELWKDPDDYQVKIMATLPIKRPWLVLKHAKKAGRRTILLCHERHLEIPKSAQAYIDHYRGFEPDWV